MLTTSKTKLIQSKSLGGLHTRKGYGHKKLYTKKYNDMSEVHVPSKDIDSGQSLTTLLMKINSSVCMAMHQNLKENLYHSYQSWKMKNSVKY